MSFGVEQHLTLRELAARLGYHPQTVRRLIRQGVIPADRATARGEYRIPERKAARAWEEHQRKLRARRWRRGR